MKSIQYLFMVLVVVIFASCARNDAPQGHFQSVPVTADGEASEWDLPLRFANKEYTISYNITNDKKNIYFILMTKDEEMEKRILKYGVSLYFDPKGETNKKFALNYPERKVDDNPYRGKVSDTLITKRMLVAQSDVYDAEGFYELESGQHATKDKRSKIQLGLKTSADSGLVYEAIIPLNYVLENGLTDRAAKKNFSIGVLVHPDPSAIRRAENSNYNNNNNGSSNSSSPRLSMGMGGGMGGFGRMGMGMGMGMGGGRSRQNTNQSAPKPVEETQWYTFRFSTTASKNN